MCTRDTKVLLLQYFRPMLHFTGNHQSKRNHFTSVISINPSFSQEDTFSEIDKVANPFSASKQDKKFSRKLLINLICEHVNKIEHLIQACPIFLSVLFLAR